MKKPLNYEHTFKIELVNEFSNGIYARLLNFILKNEIDPQDPNNPYSVLLRQLVEMLDMDLFKLSYQELEIVDGYWTNMNGYIKAITKPKKTE